MSLPHRLRLGKGGGGGPVHKGNHGEGPAKEHHLFLLEPASQVDEGAEGRLLLRAAP